MERKLAAILAADVVGYSALMESDEKGTHERLTAGRKELFEPEIARHHGRVFKLMGDGMLAEFGSVVEAVECAVSLQRGLAERNAAVPEGQRVQVRIGINLGEVIVEGDDRYGEGVNIASRLEQLADPGGICVSGKVAKEVEKKLAFGFEPMGNQKVKNIAEPVSAFRVKLDGAPQTIDPDATGTKAAPKRLERKPRRLAIAAAVAVVLLLVAAGGVIWWYPWAPGMEPASGDVGAFPPPDKPSIAVLPFNNMSGDAEQEYFADGMTEDLITDLSKVSGLFVIARNSTFAYKGRSLDIRQVAKELGVRYVLEGSVRKAADRVRINAQLIDSSTGGHLWANRYDGSLSDVFGLQDKVTQEIVTVLAVRLTAGEQARMARKETDSAEAYDAFLQGWEQYMRQRPNSLRQAISYFEKAAELDPGYSRAYAALAATYWQVWKRYWHRDLGIISKYEALVRAEQLLAKAMKEPTSLAFQVSTAVLSQRGHHADAIAEGERAITLDPNDADSFVTLAGAMNLAGQPDNALRLVERGMRLNPHYPPSYLYELGLAQFGMEDFGNATASLQKAIALNPDDRWSLRLLLAAYGHLGRGEEASAVAKTAERNRYGEDPLTVRSIAFWYPFKEASDAERLAQGLRKAGVPD